MAIPTYLRYEGGNLIACLSARDKDKTKKRKGDET